MQQGCRPQASVILHILLGLALVIKRKLCKLRCKHLPHINTLEARLLVIFAPHV